MDFKQGNGQSGNIGVLPLEMTPNSVHPGSGCAMLKGGCLNMRGCNHILVRLKVEMVKGVIISEGSSR